MKNNVIKPERMLELEEIISTDNEIDFDSFLEEEQHYMRLAQVFPINEAVDLIINYKKNSSGIDEVKYFRDIQKRYSLSGCDTELRIRQAHKIMRYVKKMAKKNMNKQKIKKLF